MVQSFRAMFSFVYIIIFEIIFVRVFIEASLDCSPFRNEEHLLSKMPFKILTTKETGLPIDAEDMSEAAIDPSTGHVTQLLIFFTQFVPRTIFCLNHVKRFEVYHSHFENDQLSSQIGRWRTTLQSIKMIGTNIGARFSDTFFNLTQLESLEIFDSNFEEISPKIGLLTKLKSLSLGSNKLKILPIEMKRLSFLENLYISSKSTLKVPLTSIIDGMISLKKLYVYDIQMKTLPKDLPYLNTISMMSNNLSSLTGINELGYKTVEMKSFSFSQNPIETIPQEIGDVKNLYELYLNSGKLRTLPESIFHIATLQVLRIWGNTFGKEQCNYIGARLNSTNHGIHFICT